MKTNQKNQFVFLGVFLQLAALVLTGCGSNGSSNTTAATTTGYYVSNGQCYTSGTNTVVPYTYCGNTGALGSGYTMINGMCYQGSTPVSTTLCTSTGMGSGYQMLNGQCYTSTGQVVAINYCQGGTATLPVNGGIGTSSGVIPQVCVGYYYSPQFGSGMCYGNPDNCAGYTMVSQQTGQQVYCE